MGNQSAALRPEVLTDLEESTAFSAEEIREYYKKFMKETPQMRMSMSVDEFKKIYRKLFPKGEADSFAAHVFRNFDKDGNGRIDFREFIAAVSIQQRGSVEEKLIWLFNLYDLDGTGYIDTEELQDMISSLTKLRGRTLTKDESVTPQQIAEYIMKSVDQNNDRQLTLDEFTQGALKNHKIQKMLLGTLQAADLHV